MRLDAVFRAIGEARREDNALLPQGIWAREIKRADWAAVGALCSDVLRTRSKDLQVAAWLAESLVHRHGFAGVAPGFRLLALLCQRFWADLHPAIDDGDLSQRLAPFEWMNSRFPALLRNQPVVQSSNSAEELFTLTDYANARLLDGLRQRDPKSVERSEAGGAVSMAAFNKVRERTATEFWQDNADCLDAAAGALAELNATLERLCGREAPGLGAIADAIEDIRNFTRLALTERKPKSFAWLRRDNPRATASAVPAEVEPPSPAAELSSREEAYARLAEIATFLQRIEPHSAVPYLIHCAIGWGDLSFPQLLRTFSEAGLDIGQVFEVLGLPMMPAAPDHDNDTGA